uniref:Uncharacterized protein n=1 Tax=Amphimedon queenslandica TaxID=400682 RepID=A0A1X7TL09_AMPQE
MFLNSTYTHPGHREKLIATITLLMIIDAALTKVSCIPYCYWIVTFVEEVIRLGAINYNAALKLQLSKLQIVLFKIKED